MVGGGVRHPHKRRRQRAMVRPLICVPSFALLAGHLYGLEKLYAFLHYRKAAEPLAIRIELQAYLDFFPVNMRKYVPSLGYCPKLREANGAPFFPCLTFMLQSLGTFKSPDMAGFKRLVEKWRGAHG